MEVQGGRGGWAGKFGQREEAMKDMCGHSQKNSSMRMRTDTHTHRLLYYYCTNSRSQMWAVYTALISPDSAPTSAEQLHQHAHMHIDAHEEMYTQSSSRLELAIFRYNLRSAM